jgi:hypothetical protein
MDCERAIFICTNIYFCDKTRGQNFAEKAVMMQYAVQWVRSLIFAVQMYLAMIVIAFFGANFVNKN